MNNDKWDIAKIKDQNGKIAIVTGSSSGIGLETARVLALKGAQVIIAVRNMQKGADALAKITRTVQGADVVMMELDLADLLSIERFVQSFREYYERLDLLINNAGVMIPPFNKTTNGFELQFGTNHLGHFALTGRLIDLLVKTPKSRVVNLSSLAHKFGKIDLSDPLWETRKYKKWNAYGASKIANLYFTHELQKRYGGDASGILVAAAHPGWTATELQRHTPLTAFWNSFLAQPISMGALPTLYAATAEDVQGGDYFGPGGFCEMRGYPKKVESSERSRDAVIAEELWKKSEQLTGFTFPELEAMQILPLLTVEGHTN